MEAQVPLDEFCRYRAYHEPDCPVKKQEWVFRLEDPLALSQVRNQWTQASEDCPVSDKGHAIGDEVVEGVLSFVGLWHFFQTIINSSNLVIDNCQNRSN